MGKKIGKYELGRTLGSGAFSKVKEGVDTETGHKWAIKIIDKEQLAREHMEEQLKREIAILKGLNHPHIVHLREVMQTANHIYMVLEVVAGGELFDKIVSVKRLDEDTARRYFHQLIGAVQHCHASGIAHRDIKPENLLLDEHDNLKISDFGLSNLQPSDKASLLQTVCGTPNYVAPEVLREKGYDGFKADTWSCGVVLFVMVAGYLPFDDANQNALFNKIERGDYRMARHFSDPLKDLVAKMLVVDATKRISMDEIVKHPWFSVGYAGATRPKYVPSESDLKDAIKNEDGEIETGAGSPTHASPAKLEGAGSAVPIESFGLTVGGGLGVLIANPAEVSAAKKNTCMLALADVNDVKVILESLGCNAKPSGNGTELKSFINSAHGLMTFVMNVLPTTQPDLFVIEIRRGRGEAAEFQNFVGAFCQALGAKLKSVSNPEA